MNKPCPQDLKILAGLGSSGEHPGNCRKELVAALSDIDIAPVRYSLPLKYGKRQILMLLSQAMLLPHLLFATLWDKYQPAWQRVVCRSTEQLQSFWASQENHPAMVGHWMRRAANWSSRAIPISLHLDGVPVTGVGKSWAKSMLVISWCSLLGVGSTIDTNFLIYLVFTAIREEGPVNNTMAEVWRIIYHSFKALMRGKYPEDDPWGKNYRAEMPGSTEARNAGKWLTGASKMFGVLWVIKMDLEALYKDCASPHTCVSLDTS